MAKPRLYSFVVDPRGFGSFHGEDRETQVAAVVGRGGRHVLTWEFSTEATDREIAQFGEGVRQGYEAALKQARSALGIR